MSLTVKTYTSKRKSVTKPQEVTLQTGSSGPIGSTGPTGVAGPIKTVPRGMFRPVFPANFSAMVSAMANPVNFGNGMTQSIPFDTIIWNNSRVWNIVNPGTGSTTLFYSGRGGVFLITCSCSYLFTGLTPQTATMNVQLDSFIIGEGIQTQPCVPQSILDSTITMEVVIPPYTNVAVTMTGSGDNQSDFTISPGAGSGYISIVQID